MGFVTRFSNGACQEIKPKLNESRLPKFYQVKQLKENSTEKTAEKNLKKDSELNELWNILTKQKKKEKYSNSKNFVSRTLSQISLPQIVLKIYNTLSFLSLFFSFPLYKIPF